MFVDEEQHAQLSGGEFSTSVDRAQRLQKRLGAAGDPQPTPPPIPAPKRVPRASPPSASSSPPTSASSSTNTGFSYDSSTSSSSSRSSDLDKSQRRGRGRRKHQTPTGTNTRVPPIRRLPRRRASADLANGNSTATSTESLGGSSVTTRGSSSSGSSSSGSSTSTSSDGTAGEYSATRFRQEGIKEQGRARLRSQKRNRKGKRYHPEHGTKPRSRYVEGKRTQNTKHGKRRHGTNGTGRENSSGTRRLRRQWREPENDNWSSRERTRDRKRGVSCGRSRRRTEAEQVEEEELRQRAHRSKRSKSRRRITEDRYHDRDPPKGDADRRKARKGGRKNRAHRRHYGWVEIHDGKMSEADGGGEKTGGEAPIKGESGTLVGAQARTLPATEMLRSKEDLLSTMRRDEKLVKAVVTVQSTVRGCGARQLASRRLNARTVLRDACFGVANDLIDVYVREDAATSLINDILAEGMEGIFEPARRVEENAAAQEVLDEVISIMIREAVKLTVQEQTDSHLDEVFVRDRRNPLLATVEDIVSDSLRTGTREVVAKAVLECTEDYLRDKRLSGFVDELIENEVVRSAVSVASKIFKTSTALHLCMELEREVCVAEALSVVAETMAPFENQLLRLQREKDEVAVQAAAQHVIVKSLQLKHAARTIGQRGRLVLMSEINRKTLSLLIAGRFLATLRAAEENRLRVSTSPLLFLLFRRLIVRTGRDVLLEELSRELDRDETALHALELQRMDKVDCERKDMRTGADAGTGVPRLPP